MLLLEFASGKVYRYEGVPRDLAEELADADTPILVFNAQVRSAFTGRPTTWPQE